MDIKKFLSESRAVSPVIGVILMVAITVILAAVIGTFVLGLGDQVGDNAPQASFSFDYDDGADNFTITHESGDALVSEDLSVAVSSDANATWVVNDGADDSLNAGETISVTLADTTELSDNDVIRVVWTSDNGDSATLQKYTYNA